MGLFLTMNGADLAIQTYFPDATHYMQAGSFPVSQFIMPLLKVLICPPLFNRAQCLVDAHYRNILLLKLPLLFKALAYSLSIPNTYLPI